MGKLMSGSNGFGAGAEEHPAVKDVFRDGTVRTPWWSAPRT